MVAPPEQPPLLIAGAGRSGTTWLANVLAADGDVVYKHEPFPPRKRTPWHAWLTDLGTVPPEVARTRFYDLARECYREVDVLPLTNTNLDAVAEVLHKAAGRSRAARAVYSRVLRRDLRGARVLVKDVWAPSSALRPFHDALGAGVVTIIRHPLASIASALKGIEMGVFVGDPEGKRERIRLLARDLPEDSRLTGLLADLPARGPAELEAIRWRFEAELSLAEIESMERGHVMVYEDMVSDPRAALDGLTRALGWTVGEGALTYLARSQSQAADTTASSYYQTQRSADQALRGWRGSLSDENASAILDVLGDAPILGYWASYRDLYALG